jgi:hypothetical protein
MHYKDKILDRLAARANVAQFVSYDEQLNQRYSRVAGLEANTVFPSIEEAAAAIIRRSADRSANVRSYDPRSPKSREFVYGLAAADDVAANVRRLAADGLFTIVNETIDVRDGGVSGVLLGNLIEFAPDDTPRCVEKPGTAALPRDMGLELLELVYRAAPALDYEPGIRVEFSIHPLRRGVRQDHTIIWELEEVGQNSAEADIRWPNHFSRIIGDKAYGLLIAHLHGLPVPATTVISRRIAPFSFGQPSGTNEPWIRTCPVVQTPGKYTTARGWLDPFKLLSREDPEGTDLASVLLQEGVNARFSGAALAAETPAGPSLTIEGTSGFGDEFMIGKKARVQLPARVERAVKTLYKRAFKTLGYVRFEWVWDGRRAWIVQLHRGASASIGRTVYPGIVLEYVPFYVENGLEELRKLAVSLQRSEKGIVLVGDIGVTSHFGDVLRKARIPSVIGVTE